MIFKNNTYDFLKWTTLIGIPAAASLYSGLAPESVYDLDDLEPLQLDDDETEIEEHEDGGVM